MKKNVIKFIRIFLIIILFICIGYKLFEYYHLYYNRESRKTELWYKNQNRYDNLRKKKKIDSNTIKKEN